MMLAFGVTFAQGNGVGKRVGPQQSTRGVTVDEYFANQADLHAWLIGQTPASVLSDPISVQLTEAELDDVDRVDPAGRGPLRVGLVKQLAEPITVHCENTGRGQRRATCSGDGVFQMTRDGGFVWARAVSSPGAYGIRVHVNEFNLPADADLYFYSLDGEAYGPFQKSGPNDDGDLWLPSIMSDTGILLVRHFGPGARAELSEMSMSITEIGHIGKSFAGGDLPTTRGNDDLCGYNASCVQNATCQPSGPATAAESAAAKMLWIAGCCIYICSGGLIADTDGSSEIPYFLTANHCLSGNRAARNLEAFFQYQMNCGGPCPAGSYDPAPAPKTTGASIMSTSRDGDYTLLRLNENPPAGSTYLGWNSTPIAFTGGAALHRISHPSGAPQAYSEHAVDTNIGTCLNTPRGEFIYSDDVFGATEGGSSGSPVVNVDGEIVGQLTGCCPAGGGNCSNVCNSNNHTIDGALAFYFPQVEQYLDPAGCTTTPASCSDGVDNDCDGATDCDDTDGAEDCSAAPECDGGGGCVNPGGDPPGASCSSDATCCSNKCKGPPSNKTCR
ncbi:MAG: hypothetical protein GTN57_12200 [Acidobacteria bacterium]|nr:hypothetical protein [Acidobacteriota bacterium]NIT11809.1 hypothetical protein [Acidobacteriota bacterium]